MLYWKYSSNRIFFLNEYVILIPSAILANYVIIRKIRSDREKLKLLKILKDQIEHEKKIRRILLLSLTLSLGFTGYTYLLPRGGADFIDVDYIQCDLERGVRYLDDNRLRKIIHDLFRSKRKGKIIYITATAVCHLANLYGRTFLALPFAVGDFGLTNVYQTSRKVFATVLLGGVGPLLTIGGTTALTCAVLLATFGLRIAFRNLDVILTSSVDIKDSVKGVEPRIPDMFDVVVVNNRDKIIMSNPVKENQECWLPDQAFLNSNCKTKPTEFSNAINSNLPDLQYDELVNMQDVTGLDRVEFSDTLDLGQTKGISTNPTLNPRKAKTVNFLDKFGDSTTIDKSDTWDTNEFMVPKKRYLRTRNEL